MKSLYKCRWNKKIFGVFGGLGQYLKVDPNILRLMAIFLTIPLGLIIVPILYILLATILKDGPRCFIQPSYKRLYKSYKNKLLFGVVAGLGEYLKINPLILRIFVVIFSLVTGFFPTIITYLSAHYLIPFKP